MRDEFVLVKSEDELSAGMCVELRPCAWCGKKERFFLTGRDHATGEFHNPDGTVTGPSSKWEFRLAGKCLPGVHAFDNAIRERRLYRLLDDDTAADETATTRRKERVR